MNKDNIISKVLDIKVVSVIRLDSDKNIFKLMDTLLECNLPIAEITLTTPNALSIISEIKAKYNNEICVGAGSVLNKLMAVDAINAGAEYVVSPISDFEIIDEANKNGIASMIGAFSPTEIYKAFQHGADIIKVFPADILGMQFFKSILAPMPHLKLMPTGGVNLDNPGEWILSGACAVGIGSALIDKKAIENGEFDKIKSNAKRIISSLQKVVLD